ncbi:hypothetical protein DJ031_06865 [bacterium endosymbiont of Escarpia laminata]|nr:MAG: hypothetical protein DJ031_06865 [bacterium endosymbiont of Escarpia laminata]
MAIRRHKNGWEVDVTSRRAGVRIKRIVGTKKEATALEAEIRQQIIRDTLVDRGIEQALDRYLKGEATGLKSYKSLWSISRAIMQYIEGRTFSQVGEVADNIKTTMLADGLAKATINRRLALLRRLCNLAFDWGWTSQNQSRRVKLLPGETERHYYLTPDQVESIAANCPHTGDLIRIAAYTGLRRGELLGLKPDQISEQFIILGTDTKTARPRLVPIPEQIAQIVDHLPLPLPPNTNHLLRTEFEAARASAGMQHIRFHDLRHTYASLLAQAGATLHLIGKAMGHSTPTMTSRYAHLVSDNLLDLARRLDGLGAAK